jgi:hypothetical protein
MLDYNCQRYVMPTNLAEVVEALCGIWDVVGRGVYRVYLAIRLCQTLESQLIRRL